MPLSGLTVIDLSTVLAGPLTAALLGDYGARVIKVEQPEAGDIARSRGLLAQGQGSWWSFLSRNKECMTCNLANSEGASIFLRIVQKADVLIENLRPGRLERWGLAPEAMRERNPGLVALRLSGFGQEGEYSTRPGYGTILEAMTGFAHLTGLADGPPTLPGTPIADGSAGMMGAYAVMVALWKREHSGRGSVIDLPLYAPMLQLMGSNLAGYDRTGIIEQRTGNRMGAAPRNAHRCQDGQWVAYAVGSATNIRALTQLLGLNNDAEYSDPEQALQNGDELDRRIGEWISLRDRATVLRTLIAAGIPVASVNTTEDVMKDRHFNSRGDFVPFRERDRVVRLPMRPFRIADSAPAQDEVNTTGGELGRDTDRLLKELAGLDDAAIARLRQAHAI